MLKGFVTPLKTHQALLCSAEVVYDVGAVSYQEVDFQV